MRSFVLSGVNQWVPLPAAPFIYYRGLTVREASGAGAVIRVWDSSTGPNGQLLDGVSVAGFASGGSSFNPPKIARVGLYVQALVGLLEGTINFD